MATPPNLPARRPRHDGWTVERQENFLKALANCGRLTHVASAVGMSRQSANNLYNALPLTSSEGAGTRRSSERSSTGTGVTGFTPVTATPVETSSPLRGRGLG